MIKHIGARYLKGKTNSIYPYMLLVVITLLAAALRFYKLGEWSFWIEEHHSLRHAAAIGSFESILLNTRPLFFLLIKPVLIFLGVSEWTARLVPALIGVVSIPFLYGVTKKIFGLPVALLAATLLTISPWHLYWSQNARFYTLFLLLYNLSLFSFYWGLEKDQFRYIVASVMTLALAGATHGLAILLVPIFVIYFFLLKGLPFEKPPGLRLRNLMPLIGLPLIGYIVYEAYRIYAGDILLFSKIYALFFDKSTRSFIGHANPYVMLAAVIYYIGTPLALLSLPGSVFLLKEKNRAGLLLTLGALAPLSIMMLLTLFASTANRYVFMSLPCWVILGAVAVKELYLFSSQKVGTTSYGRLIRQAQGLPLPQVIKKILYILAKARKGLLVWILLGILLLLLKDPVLEDVIYYLGEKKYFALFLMLGALTCLLGALWLSRLTYIAKHRGILVWGFGILLILLVHPIVADSLYYAYQHGHRNNWKDAAETIRTGKVDGDTVFAASYPLATHYLGEKVKSMDEVNLDVVLQYNQRAWFIEDDYMYLVMGGTFEKWAEANCDLAGAWDQYVVGRNWKMRVHLCGPAELGINSQVSK